MSNCTISISVLESQDVEIKLITLVTLFHTRGKIG